MSPRTALAARPSPPAIAGQGGAALIIEDQSPDPTPYEAMTPFCAFVSKEKKLNLLPNTEYIVQHYHLLVK